MADSPVPDGFDRLPLSGPFAGVVALQCSLLATAFQMTNPDYNFPGVVELLLIGTAFGCLGLVLRRRGVWARGDGWTAALLVVLLGLLGIRYVLAMRDPANASALDCLAMPGPAGQIECLLQLPFWTNYGLRQLLAHSTSLTVFLASAGLARMAGPKAASLAPALLVTPALFALAAVSPKFITGRETLAGWNFVLNEISGTARGSGLTSNPGWLWPLLIAPGAVAAGLVASPSVGRRVAGVLALGLMVFAIGDTGQRGGMLAAGLLLGCALVFGLGWRVTAFSRSWERRVVVTIGVLGLSAVAVAAGARYIDDIASWLGEFAWLRGFGASPFVLTDRHRAVMWQCAWDGLQPVFWTGNGYASWLRVASAVCPGSRDIYDTAHNLWVQSYFELGALHGTVVVATLAGLLLAGLFRRTRRPIEVQAAALAFVPASVLVTLVQEIDYVPATYYMFATISGYLWGSSWPPDRNGTATVQARPAVRRLLPIALVAAGVCAIGGSVTYLRMISWGGYTLAPVDVNGFAFSRWFRPDGAIAATADESERSFSVYPFADTIADGLRVTAAGSPEEAFAMTPTGITAANGSGWRPIQHRYTANARFESLSRLNAFPVLLPPLQSNYIIFAESGTAAWEFSADRVPYKRCPSTCSIEFMKVAPRELDQRVWVIMDTACLSPQRPTRLRYALHAAGDARQSAEHAVTGELGFTQPGKPEGFSLPKASKSPARWRLDLTTDPGCAVTGSTSGGTSSCCDGARILLGK